MLIENKTTRREKKHQPRLSTSNKKKEIKKQRQTTHTQHTVNDGIISTENLLNTYDDSTSSRWK